MRPLMVYMKSTLSVEFSSTTSATKKELACDLVATVATTIPRALYSNLFDLDFELEDAGVIFVVAATNNVRVFCNSPILASRLLPPEFKPTPLVAYGVND